MIDTVCGYALFALAGVLNVVWFFGFVVGGCAFSAGEPKWGAWLWAASVGGFLGMGPCIYFGMRLVGPSAANMPWSGMFTTGCGVMLTLVALGVCAAFGEEQKP